MAMDHDKQYQSTMDGAHFEFGEAEIGTDGTVEVVTYMSVVKAAFANWKAPSAATEFLFDTGIKCDRIVTAGKVTFKEAGGAHEGTGLTLNSGNTFSYCLVGLP